MRDDRVLTALSEWADRTSERVPETRASDVWARPPGRAGTDMEMPGRPSRWLLVAVTGLAALASTAVVVVDVLDNDTTPPPEVSTSVEPEILTELPAGVSEEISRFNAVSATPALLPDDVPEDLSVRRATASAGARGSAPSIDVWYADPSLTRSIHLWQSGATTEQREGKDPSEGGKRGEWSYDELASGPGLRAATRFDEHTVVAVDGNVSRAELERFVAGVSETYRDLPD